MLNRSSVVITAALLGGVSFFATAAASMPVSSLADLRGNDVERVGFVCGQYRCFWRPDYDIGPFNSPPAAFYWPGLYGVMYPELAPAPAPVETRTLQVIQPSCNLQRRTQTVRSEAGGQRKITMIECVPALGSPAVEK